jgi:hypothetical protein
LFRLAPRGYHDRVSLSFIGRAGSFERRWIVYALLRDNVQHYLEAGESASEFRAIRAIGDALAHGEVKVSARRLHAEVVRVTPLLTRPLADLAISTRTRAACMLELPLPDTSSTALASSIGWQPPLPTADAKTLGDVFGSLVQELLRITENADVEEQVTVLDT